jgi:acetolactate synthase-1/2/3 large subunit
MARVTGKAGVCLATSGPGATNLLTAVADARLDSVPLVAITGQVPTPLIGSDAFQEVDTYGLTLPITKHNFFVRHPEELLEIVPAAFGIAESGRPGPVCIDLPKDVQTRVARVGRWPDPWLPSPPAPCAAEAVAPLAEMIRRSRRPVLYVGGGIITSGASEELALLASRNSIPVASTLAGLGAFPSDDPLFLGMLGMHGARSTNMILDEADLLVAVGVRFDDRATGRAQDFCRHASIAHIDIDPSEIDKIKPANLSLVGDAGEILRALAPAVPADDRVEWRGRAGTLRSRYGPVPPPAGEPFHPRTFIRRLSVLAGPDAAVATDVGQHQMWVAQEYPFRRPRGLLTSGGLGTMGFGLPAAIGASLAKPGTPVLCVSGDGSFLMNIQELATLSELGLNVTVAVMNNRHLGLVRQQQELFYGGRLHASRFEAEPDFAAIARGFGIAGYDLEGDPDPMSNLEEALSLPGPAVINVPVHHAENVLPMVPPGGANDEMIWEEPTHV